MESFSREVIFSSQETMGILTVEFSNLMKFCGITSQIHIKKKYLRIVLAEVELLIIVLTSRSVLEDKSNFGY